MSLQLTMIVLGQNTLAADGAQVDSKLMKWAIVQGGPFSSWTRLGVGENQPQSVLQAKTHSIS